MSNIKQRSPFKDHEPFKWVPGKLGKPSVTLIDQLAEEDFDKRYGQRSVKVHLIKRHSGSGLASRGLFAIQPKFVPYVYKYPDNKSVFYEIDLQKRTAVPCGWLRHSEIEEVGIKEAGGGLVVYERHLHPVKKGKNDE